MGASTTNGPTVVASKKSSGSLVTRWFKALIAFAVLYVTCSFLDSIKHRWYVFDPEELHELAQAAIAAAPSPSDTSSMVSYIIRNLTSTYPSTRIAINTNESEWVFNNAGGAMGAMVIIHASITEYLIVFGSPLGTEGHSGIHTADDYFNILVGEQWAFEPPSLKMERYPPGSVHHLPRGRVKQYKTHTGCFALEYARGWIPPMLPFGFMDTLTSTLDYKSFGNTTWLVWRAYSFHQHTFRVPQLTVSFPNCASPSRNSRISCFRLIISTCEREAGELSTVGR